MLHLPHLSDIAVTMIALAIAGTLGLLFGKLKIKGVGLGIGGVLFSGIAVGHFSSKLGIEFDGGMMHFVREFGLILFVYTIGIQVGPSFFQSFKADGLKLNLAALAIVSLGVGVTVFIFFAFGLDVPALVGVMSGSVTNTPGLGAATQVLTELGFTDETLAMTGLGYAVAYPFGIVGILLTMLGVRYVLGIDLDKEGEEYQREMKAGEAALPTIDIEITNPNLDGLQLGDVPDLYDGDVVASRMRKSGELIVPARDTVVHLGDSLHVVGPAKALKAMKIILGKETDQPLTTKGTNLTWARLVVTEQKAVGAKLRDLAFQEGHDVTVSRINRAGVELPPRADAKLAFGDIITIVGMPDDINAVKMQIGNERSRLDEVQFDALFVGIALGILIGSIPLAIPGLSAPMSLGLAGGPLVAAILLGRLGSWGPFVWFMPPVANHALREIGIVLFLAVVGITSGGRFLETLIHGPGLTWMGYGVMITLIPLMTVGFVARLVFKFNYLSLAGVLAGSMTDPPALAFAVSMSPTAAASVAYVSVYPLVMFLRILAPQLIVLLLIGLGGGAMPVPVEALPLP